MLKMQKCKDKVQMKFNKAVNKVRVESHWNLLEKTLPKQFTII